MEKSALMPIPKRHQISRQGRTGRVNRPFGSRYLPSLLCLVFWILFNFNPVFCWETETQKRGKDPAESESSRTPSAGNLGTWLASFFRDHISAVDGDRCPSSPSCSSYSFQAFQKHGFFVGWVMTVDRLIHEGDESKISPMVRQNGKYYVFDPVANNDFWWYNSETSNGE